jgi:signal transduction histidine kinase
MTSRSLPERTPYALALRWLVHALLYLLVAIAAVRVVVHLSDDFAGIRLVLLVGLVSVYSIGARMASSRDGGHRGSWWSLRYLVPATVLWAAGFAFSPDAVWIAFGLDFAVLYALPVLGGVIALLVVTGIGVGGYALWQDQLGVAEVVGPVIGGLVALAVVSAVRALQDEIDERTRLARDLLEAQDTIARTQRETARAEERDRIARELHDTVAQSALSIQMLLDAARAALESGDTATAARHVSQARSTAALTSRQTRSFVDEDASADSARPLEDRLRDALEELSPGQAPPALSLRWDVPTEALSGASARVTRAAERMVRSLVGNVVQHSDARRAVVTVAAQAGDLTLDVVDDGVGFEPGADEGFGLRTVRARARSVGGSVTIESTPGEGTAVQIVLPLAGGVGGEEAEREETDDEASDEMRSPR